jgi:hypothetical protein
MFTITADKSIYLTRGDMAVIEVNAHTNESEPYVFKVGDVVRLKVFTKKQHDDIVLTKDVVVNEETTTVDIQIDRRDTKIGGVINKPVDYWYEIELNPDTSPQTIVGYDSEGPKIFRLFPEGGDTE